MNRFKVRVPAGRANKDIARNTFYDWAQMRAKRGRKTFSKLSTNVAKENDVLYIVGGSAMEAREMIRVRRSLADFLRRHLVS